MRPTRPRLSDIIRATSELAGVPREAMYASHGPRNHIEARWCAAWVARSVGYSILQAAKAMEKNHTTLLSGVAHIDAAIRAGDRAIIADLETIEMRAKELTRKYYAECRGGDGETTAGNAA